MLNSEVKRRGLRATGNVWFFDWEEDGGYTDSDRSLNLGTQPSAMLDFSVRLENVFCVLIIVTEAIHELQNRSLVYWSTN